MPYIQNALNFTIEAILGFYLIIVILRFLFQLFRVDFRNPISQMVVKLTTPPLQLLRRFIPGLFGIDFASVVLILFIGFIKTFLLSMFSGYPANVGAVFIISLAETINTITWVFILTLLASVVLSWVAPHSHHPAARMVNDLSEPILKPFRRIIPPIQGIDLTPILAFLALNLVTKLVVHPLMDLGRGLLF